MQPEPFDMRLSGTINCNFDLLIQHRCQHGPQCPHKKCLSLCIDCGFSAFMLETADSQILPALPREIYTIIYKILIDLQHRDDEAAREKAVERYWEQKFHRMTEWRKGNYVD